MPSLKGGMSCSIPMDVHHFDLGAIERAKAKVIAARRGDAEEVLRSLGAGEESIKQMLDGFTMSHLVIVPRALYQQLPVLQELAFVRPHSHIDIDSVVVVDASQLDYVGGGS